MGTIRPEHLSRNLTERVSLTTERASLTTERASLTLTIISRSEASAAIMERAVVPRPPPPPAAPTQTDFVDAAAGSTATNRTTSSASSTRPRPCRTCGQHHSHHEPHLYNYKVTDDSHYMHLTHAGAADVCIATEIGNFPTAPFWRTRLNHRLECQSFS